MVTSVTYVVISPVSETITSGRSYPDLKMTKSGASVRSDLAVATEPKEMQQLDKTTRRRSSSKKYVSQFCSNEISVFFMLLRTYVF